MSSVRSIAVPSATTGRRRERHGMHDRRETRVHTRSDRRSRPRAQPPPTPSAMTTAEPHTVSMRVACVERRKVHAPARAPRPRRCSRARAPSRARDAPLALGEARAARHFGLGRVKREQRAVGACEKRRRAVATTPMIHAVVVVHRGSGARRDDERHVPAASTCPSVARSSDPDGRSRARAARRVRPGASTLRARSRRALARSRARRPAQM